MAVEAEGLRVVELVLLLALLEQPLVHLRRLLHLRTHLVVAVLLLFDDLADYDLLLFLLDGVDHGREHVHVADVGREALLQGLVFVKERSVFLLPSLHLLR